MLNILLTSVGRRTYLIDYFKEAMKDIGNVYASNSEYTYTLSHADDYVITPPIYDEGYISFLISYCSKYEISAIISLFDIDLLILAKYKNVFIENGIFVIVADENIIRICNDKWMTYQFLAQTNIKCPDTYLSLNDVRIAIDSGMLQYPIILKPRWGMGSIGIFIAENNEELNIFTRKIYNQIFNSYLKYESKQTENECILYQELLQGIEYGLDVFNDFNSHFVSVVAKKKIAMRAGETDIAETVASDEFMEIAKKLSTKLKHIGNLDVDIIKTIDGTLYVLELNCRFGGQYPFSHVAGVNYPKQIVMWLMGQNTDQDLLCAKQGVRSCKDLVPVVIE